MSYNEDENENIEKEKLMRDEDELEFEDEAEYTPLDSLRDKYKKYRYIQSFFKTEWNKYVS